jgi:hypothetical protein
MSLKSPLNAIARSILNHEQTLKCLVKIVRGLRAELATNFETGSDVNAPNQSVSGATGSAANRQFDGRFVARDYLGNVLIPS